MKTLIALACLALCGCSTVAKLPPHSCESWTHVTAYGPFFNTHFTAVNASKSADGTLAIGNYTGEISVMGIFTNSDSFHDLVIKPKSAPTALYNRAKADPNGPYLVDVFNR